MPTISPQYSLGSYRGTNFSVPGKAVSSVQHAGGLPHLRPSMPNGLVQVAYNPFFDTIRQNIELNRNSRANHNEGIPLQLPRRVRRRVGELPFEWLRQIARKSRHVTESSSTSAGESDISSDVDNTSDNE